MVEGSSGGQYYPGTDKHKPRRRLSDEEKAAVMGLLNANPMGAGDIIRFLKLDIPVKILTDFIGKNDEIEVIDSCSPRKYRLRNCGSDSQQQLF